MIKTVDKQCERCKLFVDHIWHWSGWEDIEMFVCDSCFSELELEE